MEVLKSNSFLTSALSKVEWELYALTTRLTLARSLSDPLTPCRHGHQGKSMPPAKIEQPHLRPFLYMHLARWYWIIIVIKSISRLDFVVSSKSELTYSWSCEVDIWQNSLDGWEACRKTFTFIGQCNIQKQGQTAITWATFQPIFPASKQSRSTPSNVSEFGSNNTVQSKTFFMSVLH